jgi:polyhydroxyalkanoate synthase
MVVKQMIKIVDSIVKKASPSKYDPVGLGQTYWKFWSGVMQAPGDFMAKNLELAADQMKLLSYGVMKAGGMDVDAAAAPDKGDRRFSNPAWSEKLTFDLIKQSYLLTSKYVMNTVGAANLEPQQQRKLDFYSKQMMDAFSPSNFAATNPEVLQAIAESKGGSLLKGLKNLAGDFVEGKGKLKISMVDKSKFEVGVNIATTPGKVVFQNDLMQLIQYEPTTKKVFEKPLLIFPPWINKFYILDLGPKNSFIKWAVSKGYTVFIVSWVNPDEKLSDKRFEDYMNEGIFGALDAVQQATGVEQVNAIGYCIGGTLLACALSNMATTGDDRINSATFFTAQVDFSEPGDLAVYIDEAQLDSLDKKMAETGLLDGKDMGMAFNMLRSNDLIWSYVVNNYLLGKSPAAFDLLYWNADSTRMPVAMHSFYLREMYLHNKLVEPGGISMNGLPVDLTKIEIPVFLQSGKDDHIAPYGSVYKATHHYSGPVTFMLAGSGHIAGVVNPPAANKYYHYTNTEVPHDVEDWIEGAEYHEGSWWPYWHQWLYRKSGRKIEARIPGDGELEVIEDAPGSYVKG